MTEYIALQALNGLIIGLLYSLMASGLSLIFSVLKVINFAHGEIYMLGGFASYYLTRLLEVNPIIAIFVAIIITFLIGMAIEILLLRPIYTGTVERKDEYAILITFGLSIFLQNLALTVFGPWTKNPASFISGITTIGFLTISNDRLAAAAIAITLILILFVIIQKTFIGKALRAVSQDRDAASIVGINPYKMNLIAFSAGAALAGSAGALIGPIFFVEPTMGTLPAIKSFVIIVLGGIGSIKGSIIAGLI
ncbi:MAG: branched-chain amino acid ABC transporter permease, partial [Candidatus Bathyarchaeia archaeon]